MKLPHLGVVDDEWAFTMKSGVWTPEGRPRKCSVTLYHMCGLRHRKTKKSPKCSALTVAQCFKWYCAFCEETTPEPIQFLIETALLPLDGQYWFETGSRIVHPRLIFARDERLMEKICEFIIEQEKENK